MNFCKVKNIISLKSIPALNSFGRFYSDSGCCKTPSQCCPTSPDISVQTKNFITTIKLTRPKKKNAVSIEMYHSLSQAIRYASSDKMTKIIVFTGAGDYFCSGNDQSNFSVSPDKDVVAKKLNACVVDITTALIDCTKPIIAVVNGPAVGLGFTALGLCDVIYASDKAFFYAPFTVLGLSPELCSSYTLPKIMGHIKANDLLYFNARMSAKEALEAGFVTRVYKDNELVEKTEKEINALGDLPMTSLLYCKELFRHWERQHLRNVSKMESQMLFERYTSEDCKKAVQKFAARSKKKK